MVKVGDIVAIKFSLWQRYGKVIAVESAYRCNTGADGVPAFVVKHISPETGKLVKCRDPRCKSVCACCGGFFWEDRLAVFGRAEVNLFVREKMLDPKLVPTKKARK